MEKQVFCTCPMDCFDQCRFVVSVENNTITRIKGDPDHPVTQGMICKKGRGLVERFRHPDRLCHPLVRKGAGFEQASYDQVLDRISRKLSDIRKQYGPTAVMDYSGSGYNGLKGRIQSIFFDAFGGATRPGGSLCWGAGIAAQRYDFGDARGHAPEDVLNADMILVWGRNPRYTSPHLHALLKKAVRQGSQVVVIDPLESATARSFRNYIRIRPASDAALALAMAKVIIDRDLHDKAFIQSHVIGFNRFYQSLEKYTPEFSAGLTGIPEQTIEQLAVAYASADRACIYLGLGMQRYENGGNTIRSIDALAAITGNIGKKGSGVNFAAKGMKKYLNGVEAALSDNKPDVRRFSISRMAGFLGQADDPPVKAAFVSSANPLNQGPDVGQAVKQFSAIDFKVVFDHFMTDTAAQADIILPAASVFEQEDIFCTVMFSPVLTYSHQALAPPAGLMTEFDFYIALADRMGIDLGFKTTDVYLRAAVSPLLKKLDISYGNLKTGLITLPGSEVAWEEKKFETRSGSIEIYSEEAKTDGHSPLPVFIPPTEPEEVHLLRLLTCHAEESMHSQGFAFVAQRPGIYVNENTAAAIGAEHDSDVVVSSAVGRLTARLEIDNSVCDQAAFMYQGFWQKSGNVNLLTEVKISDMGQQAAFYDTFCTIVKK